MKRIKKWIFAGGIASILLSGILILTVIFTVQAAIVVIGGQQNSQSNGGSNVHLEDLPECITEEMVVALLKMQDEYGHPASTGLAQIVKESAYDYVEGLSQLAYDYKNLFGMKFETNNPFVIGSINFATGEQLPTGESYVTNDNFSVFASYTECIEGRAWKLERSPYLDCTEAYQKTGSTYTREQANSFMYGLREAGWATDLSYVRDCISIMEQYNFYRFDNMTLADYQASSNNQNHNTETGSGQEYSSATAAQRAIVDTAYNTPFAGDGLCATWVSRVFANAGQPYPGGDANTFTMSRESGGIKVGMAIVVEHSGPSGASWTYGHIGIYIGDGKVMHNESSRTGNSSNGCTITPLDEWCATYEYQCTAYYGWVNSIDLSQ